MNKATRKQFRSLRRQRLALALVGAMAAPLAGAVIPGLPVGVDVPLTTGAMPGQMVIGQVPVTPTATIPTAPCPLCLPEDGQVISGTVTSNYDSSGVIHPASQDVFDDALVLTQSSHGAIIEWGSFNIASTFKVQFNLPDATAAVLNRVVGAGQSLIDGLLASNGNVFLVNPAGIVFGGGSQVNVGGLVASTMDITNANFTAGTSSGSYQFEPMTGVGNQVISVNSGGQITTSVAGTVALLGRQVTNDGTISAPGGSVLFGSAQNITLDFQGDGLTMLTIQGPGVAKASVGCPSLPCPVVVPQLVNTGTISADGGQILMRTASTPSGIGGSIINLGGTLRAQSLVSREGRIELTTDLGAVTLGYSIPSGASYTGALDVSGQAGANGGTVLIRGNDFLMYNNDSNPSNPGSPSSTGSLIDATGDRNGGIVDIQAANQAVIYSLSSIHADGNGGNGGQVQVSAPYLLMGATAQITANGGVGSGGQISLMGGSSGMGLFGLLSARGTTAGGTVITETTADSFDFRGLRVEAGSPVAMGSWTFKAPYVSVISGSDVGELDSMTGGAYLQDAEVNHAFASNTNVTLQSTTGVNFDDAQILASGSLPQFFTVNADGAITGSGFSIASSTGPLEMRFNSDASSANSGYAAIQFSNATLDSQGGDILMYGQSDAVNGFASGDTSGIRLDSVGITTSGGDLHLRGTSTGLGISYGDAGVALYQGSIDAGSGQVLITGAGAQGMDGVHVWGDSVEMRAGSIDIHGTASGVSDGVLINGVNLITSGGDINLYGIGGDQGVVLNSYNADVHSYGGQILIHGVGSQGDGVNFGGIIDSGGGAISVYGSSKMQDGVHFNSGYYGGINSGGGDVDLVGNGAVNGVALIGFGYGNNLLDSAGGHITITGQTSGTYGAGVEINSFKVHADAGDITITGTGLYSSGVMIGSGSELLTTAGDISVSSVGMFTGLNLYNVDVATDTGHIDLRARGLSSDASGLIIAGGTQITTNSGGIELSGEGVSGAGVRIDSGTQVNAGNGLIVVRASSGSYADAIVINETIQSSLGVNLRPGGVDTNGNAYDRVSDAILIGVGYGFSLDDAELNRIIAPQLVIGSNQHAGAIQVQDAVTRNGNLTLQNGGGSGGIDLQAGMNIGNYTLALLSGGTIAQTASAPIYAHSLLAQAGGDVLLASAANDVASTTLAGTAGGQFQYQDANDLAVGNVAASGFDATTGGLSGVGTAGISAGGNVVVQNQAGDLTLNANISGSNITLVTAGTLQNTGGASLVASGNWQVWASTWVSENRGGLTGSGSLPNLFGCVYLGACGVAVGSGDNHFVYTQQPTAVITLNDVTREYGLANPVFTYGVTGLVLGDLAANAISGSATTSATAGSNVGSYAITGTFTSAAGYLIQLVPAALSVTPATLTFTADPFVRFYGMPNPDFTGSITGFRNGDTASSVFGSGLYWYSSAGVSSLPGFYAITGYGSAGNYVVTQAPGNATALRVLEPFSPDRPIDIISDLPNTYLYDRNIGGAPVCAVNASLADQQLASAGDTLSNEWSKVRSRPNLTNCFDTERRSSCGDF